MYQKSSFIILLVLASINGCSQSPTSVGNKLIPGSAKYTVHDTSIVSLSDTTFKLSETNGSGSSLLVGNSSSVNATALLLFTASMPDSMPTVQIDTAELYLTASYGWNVSLPPAPAQFEIKEVLSSWSASTVTVDSLNSLNLSPTNSSLISITNQDTLTGGRLITAQFDTSLVRKWINIYADTVLPSFFSIALVPHGMTNSGIWGFSQFGSTSPPTLEIIYEKNGIKDSIGLSIGQGTFFATTTTAIQPSAGIETQGGLSVCSIIKFNLKSVSDSINKVIVNNATLQLTLKNSQSVLGLGSADSLVGYLAGSATQFDTVGPSYYGYGYRKDTTQTTNTVYIFNLTSMVQYWINTPNNNFGVQLRSMNSTSTVDKHVFYTSKDSTYAPKLFITYTRK
ncbi:MAG: DNRLRE domain-containing protein [Bacteroidota bacterium]